MMSPYLGAVIDEIVRGAPRRAPADRRQGRDEARSARPGRQAVERRRRQDLAELLGIHRDVRAGRPRPSP